MEHDHQGRQTRGDETPCSVSPNEQSDEKENKKQTGCYGNGFVIGFHDAQNHGQDAGKKGRKAQIGERPCGLRILAQLQGTSHRGRESFTAAQVSGHLSRIQTFTETQFL